MGQLAFFAEFLHYTSPNAPAVQDVLGTWLLLSLFAVPRRS